MSTTRTRPRPRTLWETGHRPGPQVVTLACLGILVVVLVNLLVVDRLTFVFDLGFVAICVAVALQVRTRDFFVCGVLPPLLLCGTAAALGLAARDAIAEPGDGLVQAMISVLAHHAGALVVGYGLTLVVLAVRQMALQQRLPGQSAPESRTSR